MPTSDPTAFFSDVLSGPNLGINRWRLEFFEKWAAFEGCGAEWNPLATTWEGGEDPDDPWWNTFGENGQYHVRNYASRTAGLAATVGTLMLDYYIPVRATLATMEVTPRTWDAIRTWGTTGFVQALLDGWRPTADPIQPTLPMVIDAMNAAGIFDWQRGGYVTIEKTIQAAQLRENGILDRLDAIEAREGRS